MRTVNHIFLSVHVFPFLKVVVELIKTHFGDKHSAPEAPLIPTFQVPSHEEPRFSYFVESETSGVSVVCLILLSQMYRNLKHTL